MIGGPSVAAVADWLISLSSTSKRQHPIKTDRTESVKRNHERTWGDATRLQRSPALLDLDHTGGMKRVALVTGASRGLGAEVCRQLAAAGLTVWCTAREEG